MALSKNLKRKRNSENRIFHDEWTENYAFILPSFINAKPTCLICNEGVSACKEYNIRRHHETKHVTVLEELDTNKSMDDVIGSVKQMSLSARSAARRIEALSDAVQGAIVDVLIHSVSS
ncbi:hypothetical protein PAMA_008515 [Pampus argenteus]